MSADPFCLDSYDYDLPAERIAQFPPEQRGSSRLLVLDKNGRRRVDALFADLPRYLPKGAVLAANNSKVTPARLFGVRPGGGKAELLLLTPPPLLEQAARPDRFGGGDGFSAAAEVLLRPGRSIHPGDRLVFGSHIEALVDVRHDFGRHDVRLFWRDSLTECLEKAGHLPLPPYIRREQ